jgi:hypothetical protein
VAADRRWLTLETREASIVREPLFAHQGVGKIFEGYRLRTLEDDDEVAVTHGPAEANYPDFSEAMVNIRATVARAVAERVLAHLNWGRAFLIISQQK